MSQAATLLPAPKAVHHLHRRRRPLLAQPLHRPRPKKFPSRLPRRRQTLRRNLHPNRFVTGSSRQVER